MLFDLVDEVTNALSGPKVHHIIVSDEYNASINQIPQFGMFGWLRNYLVVGLPLLRALSPAEFRSVLAHEVGHLSGKHGRFSGWIYRLRQSWIQILTTVHAERHYASFLFEPFINWYAPYLNAYSFVLARAQERQADADAVELTGQESFAVMLVRMQTKKRGLVEGFWPSFFRQSKAQATTPKDPFVQMLHGLDQPVDPANVRKWFFEALRVPTGYDDTHPALADRLEAIGFAKEDSKIQTLVDAVLRAEEKHESAASYYLPELPEDFLAGLNRLWREDIASSWSETHERLKKSQKRLTALDEIAKTRALTIDEQWERVRVLDDVEDQNVTIIPSLETILREDPDHNGAHFMLGAILLEQQNPNGVEHLEKAIQLNPACAGDANALLSSFYFNQGNKELAEMHRARADEHSEMVQKQQEQALTFSNNDRFIPHGLDEKLIKDLQSQFSKLRLLDTAYLVAKVIEGSETPMYVLAFTTKSIWREGRDEKLSGELSDQLINVTGLPSPVIILPLDDEYAYLLNKVSQIEGARLR